MGLKSISIEKMSHLAENKALGAGNFLYHALNTYGSAETKRLHFDIPYKSPKGHCFHSLSLQELQHETELLASWYLSRGIVSKDRVGFYISAGPYHLVHYIALCSIGAVPVFINGNMDVKSALLFLEKVTPKLLIVDRIHDQKIKALSFIFNYVETALLDSISLESEEGMAFKPYIHGDNDPVLITHSSGTTGIPKAILMAHQQFFHAIRCHLRWPHPSLLTPAPEGEQRFLSMLPTAHNSAISHQIRNILSGIDVIIVGETSDEESILNKLEHYHPSVVISFPENYLKILQAKPRKGSLSSISHWINTGDAAHAAHIKKLVQFGQHHTTSGFRPGSIFCDGIGSSEMCNSFSMLLHTADAHHPPRCVGLPKPTIEAVILDDLGEPLPSNKVGRLGIKTSSIIPAYWNDADLYARSWLRGYWLTGDLAYQDEAGNFYHVDRLADSFETRQQRMYTVLAEEIVLTHCDEIFDCTVCSYDTPNKETLAQIIVVPNENEILDGAQLLEKINKTLSQFNLPAVDKLTVKNNREIPVDVTGKVLKRVIRTASVSQKKEVLKVVGTNA